MSSLQERVAARRAQRAKERTFVLPVRGYEDIGLYCRYKPLSWEEISDNLSGDDPYDVEKAAGCLIEACVELLEDTTPDVKRIKDKQFVGLGCRWSSAANVLNDKLGVDVPDDATARDKLLAVFNGVGGTGDLILHARDWDEQAAQATSGIDEEQADLSVPSVEGSSNSERTPSPEEWPSTPGNSIPAATLTS